MQRVSPLAGQARALNLLHSPGILLHATGEAAQTTAPVISEKAFWEAFMPAGKQAAKAIAEKPAHEQDSMDVDPNRVQETRF